jgi:hypothetical protein
MEHLNWIIKEKKNNKYRKETTREQETERRKVTEAKNRHAYYNKDMNPRYQIGAPTTSFQPV